MQECIFFEAHVNECGVKAWNYAMYFTKINVAYGEILASFFFVKLRQDFVLQIGNINFVGLGIDYKLKIHDKSVKYLKTTKQPFLGCFTKKTKRLKKAYFFFLWRFLRSRFLRLCVAILWRLRFLPLGIMLFIKNSLMYGILDSLQYLFNPTDDYCIGFNG